MNTRPQPRPLERRQIDIADIIVFLFVAGGAWWALAKAWEALR